MSNFLLFDLAKVKPRWHRMTFHCLLTEDWYQNSTFLTISSVKLILQQSYMACWKRIDETLLSKSKKSEIFTFGGDGSQSSVSRIWAEKQVLGHILSQINATASSHGELVGSVLMRCFCPNQKNLKFLDLWGIGA